MTDDEPASRLRDWLLVGVVVCVLVAGSASVGASATSAATLSLDLNPVRDSIQPGETVQVGVAIENTGSTTSPAPVLDLESLPAGWTVTEWSGTDAAYRNATNEWLWTTLEPGEVEKFTFTVEVPANASGVHELGAELTDGDERSTTGSTEVAVEADATTTAGDDDPTTTEDASGPDESTTTNEGDLPGDIQDELPQPGFGLELAAIALSVVGALRYVRRTSGR